MPSLASSAGGVWLPAQRCVGDEFCFLCCRHRSSNPAASLQRRATPLLWAEMEAPGCRGEGASKRRLDQRCIRNVSIVGAVGHGKSVLARTTALPPIAKEIPTPSGVLDTVPRPCRHHHAHAGALGHTLAAAAQGTDQAQADSSSGDGLLGWSSVQLPAHEPCRRLNVVDTPGQGDLLAEVPTCDVHMQH